ncbi:MAG: hypothetical protein HPZ00_06320 [Christensenellaceae bacterium]|nr:hypothetical protein [Christensenellaceae bacterium]DAS00367.1 MAG TPA: hemolysin [Bacteriophage sp.]
MTAEVLVALLSLLGTAIGSIAGIMAANKLTNYRISKLEEKVNKHNNLVERMTIAEQSVKSAHKRIDEINERI